MAAGVLRLERSTRSGSERVPSQASRNERAHPSGHDPRQPAERLRRLRFASRVCCIVGGLLVATALMARAQSAWAQQRILATYASGSAAAVGDLPNRAESESVDFGLWSPQRIARYRESLGLTFEPPLGVLEIPRLGLQVGILDGVDERRLDRGIGRIPGTARIGEPGNLALAGHRDGFFRPLKDLRLGDELIVRSHGGPRRYVVESVSVVSPHDVSVLDATTEPTVTLVTCYPFYYVGSAPQRYIVRASERSTPDRDPAGTSVAPEISRPRRGAPPPLTPRLRDVANPAGLAGPSKETEP